MTELIKDGDTEEHGTDEDLTVLIDGGGLWYVKETTYQFFVPLKMLLEMFWMYFCVLQHHRNLK